MIEETATFPMTQMWPCGPVGLWLWYIWCKEYWFSHLSIHLKEFYEIKIWDRTFLHHFFCVHTKSSKSNWYHPYQGFVYYCTTPDDFQINNLHHSFTLLVTLGFESLQFKLTPAEIVGRVVFLLKKMMILHLLFFLNKRIATSQRFSESRKICWLFNSEMIICMQAENCSQNLLYFAV